MRSKILTEADGSDQQIMQEAHCWHDETEGRFYTDLNCRVWHTVSEKILHSRTAALVALSKLSCARKWFAAPCKRDDIVFPSSPAMLFQNFHLNIVS